MSFLNEIISNFIHSKIRVWGGEVGLIRGNTVYYHNERIIPFAHAIELFLSCKH